MTCRRLPLWGGRCYIDSGEPERHGVRMIGIASSCALGRKDRSGRRVPEGVEKSRPAPPVEAISSLDSQPARPPGQEGERGTVAITSHSFTLDAGFLSLRLSWQRTEKETPPRAESAPRPLAGRDSFPETDPRPQARRRLDLAALLAPAPPAPKPLRALGPLGGAAFPYQS